MKQILIVAVLSSTVLLCAASLSVNEIDTMVAKIQTTRGGMNVAQFGNSIASFCVF